MKNKQKGFVALVLLGITALLVIGGGIYIYKSKKTVTPVPLTSTTKSYKNDRYGFSFSYPNDWVIQNEEEIKPNDHDEGIVFYVTVGNSLKDKSNKINGHLVDYSTGHVLVKKLSYPCKGTDWRQTTAYSNDFSNTRYVGKENDPNWGKLHDPDWDRMNYSEKIECISDNSNFAIQMIAGMDNSFESLKKTEEKIASSVKTF